MRIAILFSVWIGLPAAAAFVSPKLFSTHVTTRIHATPAETLNDAATGNDIVATNTLICGGGPAGLLTAIMMAQKGPKTNIQVFDRLGEPPAPDDDSIWSNLAKFYLIGLGGRGQTSLREFGVWDKVAAVSTAVIGRKDWSPGSDEAVERIFEGRKFTTQVLPRDKLVGVLYQHIRENYADQVTLNYGYDVVPKDFSYKDGQSVLVEVARCDGNKESDLDCDVGGIQLYQTDLLIAAEGTSRTIANMMEESDKMERENFSSIQRLTAGPPFRVKRYEDDNQRIYKTIPLNLPKDWRYDLNFSARSQDGRVNLDALPANANGGYCGVLLLRKDDAMAQPDVDPKEFRTFMDAYLPQFSAIIDDETSAQVAKKPPSFLPAFRYVGPRLNQGPRTLLLGDCAHTVKPYFGLGANTALEDVKVLSNILDSAETIPDAVQEFSDQRAAESKTLVRISRDLDRPGMVGAVSFIIPIILDSIFNKIAPKIFAPNIISMLQKDDMTFRDVAVRKRRDRVLQLAILGGALTGAAKAAVFLVKTVSAVLGRETSTVASVIVGCGAAFVLLKKAAEFMKPGLAPADVLTKTKSDIGKKDKLT